MKTYACVECGEQTVTKICSPCEADKVMFKPYKLDKSRGSKTLIGVTIARVDASAINEIKLIADDGTEFTFFTEQGPLY